MTNIQTSIRKLAGVDLADSVKMFDAKVITVNENERTVDVEMVGGKSSNRITARLMASLDDGCYVIPKEQSTVIVAMSTHVAPYVAMFSEVEKITWLGGYFDGVPIVTHPTDTNKGVLKRLNNIENKLTSLQGKFNSHVHTTTCGAGPGTASTTPQQEIGNLTPTTNLDIEHPNIKH
jgi:hypothetical protein